MQFHSIFSNNAKNRQNKNYVNVQNENKTLLSPKRSMSFLKITNLSRPQCTFIYKISQKKMQSCCYSILNSLHLAQCAILNNYPLYCLEKANNPMKSTARQPCTGISICNKGNKNNTAPGSNILHSEPANSPSIHTCI